MARDGTRLFVLPPHSESNAREQAEELSEQNPLPAYIVRNMPAEGVHYRTFQVVVATTAGGTKVLAANPKRTRAIITMITGAQIVYLGEKGLTSSTGEYFTAAAGVKETIYTQDELWGLAASAGQTVSVYEEFTS